MIAHSTMTGTTWIDIQTLNFNHLKILYYASKIEPVDIDLTAILGIVKPHDLAKILYNKFHISQVKELDLLQIVTIEKIHKTPSLGAQS